VPGHARLHVLEVVARAGYVYVGSEWKHGNHFMWIARDGSGSRFMCKLLADTDHDAEHHDEEILFLTEFAPINPQESRLLPATLVIPIPDIGDVVIVPFMRKSLGYVGRGHCGWVRNWVNVKRVLKQIVEAMAFWHTRGWLHGDIKWSHFVLDDDDQAWIIDAGSARHGVSGGGFEGGTRVAGVRGTEDYAAPEVRDHKEIDTQADMYSVGEVFCQISLSVQSAIERWDRDHRGETKGMPQGALDGPSAVELHAFHNLIKRLCAPRPRDRLTAREALEQEFFSSTDGGAGDSPDTVTSPVIE